MADTEDRASKLDDITKANQPDAPDTRGERLADAEAVTAGSQDFGPDARAQGVARTATQRSQPDADADAEPAEHHPVDDANLGGGWYEVPDVGKVQGREAAIEAYDQAH